MCAIFLDHLTTKLATLVKPVARPNLLVYEFRWRWMKKVTTMNVLQGLVLKLNSHRSQCGSDHPCQGLFFDVFAYLSREIRVFNSTGSSVLSLFVPVPALT